MKSIIKQELWKILIVLDNNKPCFKYWVCFLFILNLGSMPILYSAYELNSNRSVSLYQEPVEFEDSIIESYQSDSDYHYFKIEAEPDLWQKFKRWLNLQWNKFLDWLLSDIETGGVWEYVALILKIIVIIGIALLILWLFNKYYISDSKSTSPTTSLVNLSEEEQLLEEKDLSILAQEAETNKNYRLASRYWFLNVLKHLKDNHFIDYQFQKTNTDYKSELKDNRLKIDFTYASRFYEFVWYGDFQLNLDEFESAKLKFERIINHIKTLKANG